MASLEHFSKEIEDRLAQEQRLQRDKQYCIDRDMNVLLERKETYTEAALGLLISVVTPRMEELCRHFDNAKIKDCDPTKDFGCAATFSHTQRYPATATLRFAISPADDYKRLEVRYEVDILPILMEYDRTDAQGFPIDGLSETEVAAWVEKKLHYFLDTYLKIKTHPLYQKDNFVVDPVCGMRIPFFEVAATVERRNRTVYFCSEVCKETFLRSSE
jgi:YHS domain-containing protein